MKAQQHSMDCATWRGRSCDCGYDDPLIQAAERLGGKVIEVVEVITTEEQDESE